MRKLMPHQEQALKWASVRSKIALFMEMRLGKTLVAIRWCEERELERILVLTPKSVLDAWKGELEQESIRSYMILEGSINDRLKQAKRGGPLFTLTNYETVSGNEEILSYWWDGIILDESTKIKNTRTRITKVLNKYTINITHRAILTGLPNPESELDYYEQMKFLQNSFMNTNNFWEWRNRYFIQTGFDWSPKKGTVNKIREAVADSAFVLTSDKAGLGKRKIYEKRFVSMTQEQWRIYREIEKKFEYEDRTGQYHMTKWLPVKLSWMQRICGGFDTNLRPLSWKKYVEIEGLLKSELRNKSIVVWFKHTAEIMEAQKFFNKKGIDCAIFTADKKKFEKEFKHGNRQLMLAQAKCGQFGLNWSVADVSINYSSWWSGEIRAQTEKRIEHPKKKRPLLYIDLLSKNTIDEDILETLWAKKLNSKGFLNAVIKKWRKRNALGNN